MTVKSNAYEVGFRVTEYRSIYLHATSPEEAIAKAQQLRSRNPNSELFVVTTDPDSDWRADKVEP
ncbi:hypothetical protein W911_03690 [Hyphomicrobium nitrativorans NL23]|uniref:Uncharacterized protein n=1 Tax=Hyphomicrobium nitrativorans NL23 TaxID=1029756 RepID=V5SGB6_9HYPH|nr:hypothetical protein [Hyphomicrobium nitrativorans]AHB49906.1 hypothetical protein W911_03690 [Hyphomicrobium nitrativorans NL23]